MNVAPDPTNAHEVCEHVLNIIHGITSAQTFALDKECRRLFRQGDAGGKPGNLVGFDRIFTEGKTWNDVRTVIERAAAFHGNLCVIAQKFADEVNGVKSTTIDKNVFRAAGEVVRTLCPPGSILDMAAAGAWCTWP